MKDLAYELVINGSENVKASAFNTRGGSDLRMSQDLEDTVLKMEVERVAATLTKNCFSS